MSTARSTHPKQTTYPSVTPQPLWRVLRNLPAPWPILHQPPLLLPPGVATYTDKLFKFRNSRWEDILSDEVNVARGVASLFAGRSVACVDRTVSSGVRGGLGAGGAHSSVRARGEPIGRCAQTE